MSRTHEQNLECIRSNLQSFRGYAKAQPTGWNLGRVEALQKAEADYLRYMAGEIQHHEMCWTAVELTMAMPDWGTRGT